MKIYFLFLAALVETWVEIQSTQVDPGPLAEGKSTRSPAPNIQKRQATDDITLYLSPNQIKALQSGEITISSLFPDATTEQNSQKHLTFEENNALLREQFENIKAARLFIPVHEPAEKDSETISETPTNKDEEQNIETENGFQQFEYDVPLRQQGTLKNLQTQEQWNYNKPEIQRDMWVAYDPDSEKKFEQKWNKILELNRKQLKVLSDTASQIQNSEESIKEEKPLLQLQYGTKYNDQKNAIRIEKIIRERHQDELNKQSDVVQAEAIGNSPILIQEKVTITKHRPVFRPLPASTSVPISEPNKENIPYPYLQLFKQTPLPKGEENIDDKEQLAVSLSKQKTEGEDRPIIVRKIVPYPYNTKNEKPEEITAHKSEKITILRPVSKY